MGETVRMGGAPLSPTLSPFVPHGARETDALGGRATWAWPRRAGVPPAHRVDNARALVIRRTVDFPHPSLTSHAPSGRDARAPGEGGGKPFGFRSAVADSAATNCT